MMTSGFTCFPNGGLGEPKLYQNLVCFTRMWGFYKNVGFYLEGVWLWRISGGYSLEMMGLV